MNDGMTVGSQAYFLPGLVGTMGAAGGLMFVSVQRWVTGWEPDITRPGQEPLNSVGRPGSGEKAVRRTRDDNIIGPSICWKIKWFRIVTSRPCCYRMEDKVSSGRPSSKQWGADCETGLWAQVKAQSLKLKARKFVKNCLKLDPCLFVCSLFTRFPTPIVVFQELGYSLAESERLDWTLLCHYLR